MTSYVLPEQQPWRYLTPIGVPLGQNHVIRSNFFPVDVTRIPTKLYQYSFQVHPFVTPENKFSTEDCTATEDSRILWSLFKKFCGRHPEWNIRAGAIGTTYDGRSFVVTSFQLPFPPDRLNAKGEPCFADDMNLSYSDGRESSKRFKVSLTLVAIVNMPGDMSIWKNANEQQMRLLDSSFMNFAKSGITEDNPDWLTVGSAVSIIIILLLSFILN
jgi:hypothetical protein